MGGFSTAVPQPFTGLNVTPPDPYSNLRALAMQGQIAQQRQTLAAGQQEMAGRQQQMQLVDQQIKDQQALAQTLSEWTPGTTSDEFVKSVIKNGGSGAAGLQAQQHFTELGIKNAQLSKEQLGLQQTRHNQLAGQIQSVIDAKPEDKQALYAQYLPEIRKELDPNETVPDIYPGDTWGAGQVKGHQLIADQTKQHQEQALAGKAEAEAGEAKAKTEHQQYINELIKTGNQAAANGQNPIDAIFPASLDKLVHDGYANAWTAAGRQPPDENGRRPAQDSILSAAASHAAEFRKATSHVMQAAAANEARLKEQATADIKTNIAVNTQRQLNATSSMGNIPPHLIPQYQSEVAKVANAYGDAANAANEMQEMIDLMRGGNKIAYAYSPTTGVLTINTANGVKRVNMAEIGQYGGAGSLLDNITGFFGKKLTGEGVPANIVDAMEQFHSTLGENSRNTASAKIQTLNKLYGGTTNPDDILIKPTKANAPPRGGATAGTVRMQAPDGTIKPVPAEQVEHFKSKGAKVVQ